MRLRYVYVSVFVSGSLIGCRPRLSIREYSRHFDRGFKTIAVGNDEWGMFCLVFGSGPEVNVRLDGMRRISRGQSDNVDLLYLSL